MLWLSPVLCVAKIAKIYLYSKQDRRKTLDAAVFVLCAGVVLSVLKKC
jgi:hypothetical protein